MTLAVNLSFTKALALAFKNATYRDSDVYVHLMGHPAVDGYRITRLGQVWNDSGSMLMDHVKELTSESWMITAIDY